MILQNHTTYLGHGKSVPVSFSHCPASLRACLRMTPLSLLVLLWSPGKSCVMLRPRYKGTRLPPYQVLHHNKTVHNRYITEPKTSTLARINTYRHQIVSTPSTPRSPLAVPHQPPCASSTPPTMRLATIKVQQPVIEPAPKTSTTAATTSTAPITPPEVHTTIR